MVYHPPSPPVNRESRPGNSSGIDARAAANFAFHGRNAKIPPSVQWKDVMPDPVVDLKMLIRTRHAIVALQTIKEAFSGAEIEQAVVAAMYAAFG